MFDFRVSKSLTWMICVSKFDFARKQIVLDQRITSFDFQIFDLATSQRFDSENVPASGGAFPGEIRDWHETTGHHHHDFHSGSPNSRRVRLVARSQRFTYTNV